jgi:hypothetical protein
MNIVYFVNGQQIEKVCYEFIPKHEEFNKKMHITKSLFHPSQENALGHQRN